MTAQRFLGVDGCKAGWFCVAVDESGDCDFGVYPNLENLWKKNRSANLILIDIPIGLAESGPCLCDVEARKLLGPKRAMSVFTPPCRATLKAHNYKLACQINLTCCGKKISRQTWGILAKIKEADNLLHRRPEARPVFRETHPEVCFYGLNGLKAITRSKKDLAGLKKRLDLLQRHVDKSRAFYHAALERFWRKEVARDDIVDTLAAAIAGFLSKGALTSVPDNPPTD